MTWNRSSSGTSNVSTSARCTPAEMARRYSGDLPCGMAIRTSGIVVLLSQGSRRHQKMGACPEIDKRRYVVGSVRKSKDTPARTRARSRLAVSLDVVDQQLQVA